MPGVRNVLIVGGGTVGNALAVLLRRASINVDLVEIDPGWSTLGSGITLQGNALRVLREVGVWDEVKANIVARPAHLDEFKTGGPDLPGSCGMYRPKLQEILIGAVGRSGTRVRLGITVDELVQRDGAVDVLFSDRARGRYDLVVGADGIHSKVRSMLGIKARPKSTGLAIWRVYARRPARLHHGIQHGGVHYIAGYNPVSPTHLYAYIVEDVRDRAEIRRLDPVAEMRRLTEPLGDPWPAIREDIREPSQIDYRSFEYLNVAWPWHRGRVIIVGDAAHACPPTLAQGAAMGLEDASVLAELLIARDTLDEDLFSAFQARRSPRVSRVLEASVAICDAVKDPRRAPHAMSEQAAVARLLSTPA
jgi:2-polyprenyl-6-methoxyphenol hydroxylase-like FAD-dependent oxidoreductase